MVNVDAAWSMRDLCLTLREARRGIFVAWKIALDLDHYRVMSTAYRWNEMRKPKHILSMKIAATAKEEEVSLSTTNRSPLLR